MILYILYISIHNKALHNLNANQYLLNFMSIASYIFLYVVKLHAFQSRRHYCMIRVPAISLNLFLWERVLCSTRHGGINSPISHVLYYPCAVK